MLELLVKAVKASITVHCQQLKSFSIAFAEECNTFFFLVIVMWTADTGLAAFVFMGYVINFFSQVNEKKKWQREREK